MRKVSGEGDNRAAGEGDHLAALKQLMQEGPGLHAPHWNHQLLTYVSRQTISRLLYWDQLYRGIVEVPGVILELGVHYGATLSTLSSLRGIYEPFNSSRRIVGFDTFAGFPSVDVKDGPDWEAGDYATPEGYERHLTQVLGIHQELSPLPHIDKFELVVGDVVETFGRWLDDNPGTLVAMVIFDMDIYEPTRHALELVQPRLTRGSTVVFDELSYANFPGETVALQEVVGSPNVRLRRSPLQTNCGWYVVGDA